MSRHEACHIQSEAPGGTENFMQREPAWQTERSSWSMVAVCVCVSYAGVLSVKRRLLRLLVWKPRSPSSFDGLSSVQSYPHLIV